MKTILAFIALLFLPSLALALEPVPYYGSDVYRVPGTAVEDIKEMASDKWPSNYQMQSYEVQNQEQAYMGIANYVNSHVPSDIAMRIRNSAQQKWPNDYQMQLYEIQQQSQAYARLHPY